MRFPALFEARTKVWTPLCDLHCSYLKQYMTGISDKKKQATDESTQNLAVVRTHHFRRRFVAILRVVVVVVVVAVDAAANFRIEVRCKRCSIKVCSPPGGINVRWRPGQEISSAPPCSNLMSKCTLQKKVIATLLGLFGARDIFAPAARGIVLPLPPSLRPCPHYTCATAS